MPPKVRLHMALASKPHDRKLLVLSLGTLEELLEAARKKLAQKKICCATKFPEKLISNDDAVKNLKNDDIIIFDTVNHPNETQPDLEIPQSNEECVPHASTELLKEEHEEYDLCSEKFTSFGNEEFEGFTMSSESLAHNFLNMSFEDMLRHDSQITKSLSCSSNHESAYHTDSQITKNFSGFTSQLPVYHTAHCWFRALTGCTSLESIQSAIEYGISTIAGKGCTKYEHEGLTCIVKSETNELITCFSHPFNYLDADLGNFVEILRHCPTDKPSKIWITEDMLKGIRTKTNTKINCSPENIFTITGNPVSVEQARIYIDDAIDGNGDEFRLHILDLHTGRVSIKENCAGVVIGKNGFNLEKMKTRFGVKDIKVTADVDDNGESCKSVAVIGREGNVRVACRYIVSISSEARGSARLGEVRTVINSISNGVKNILLDDKARCLNFIKMKLYIRNLFLDRVTKCIEITSDNKFKNTAVEHVILALEAEVERAVNNKRKVSCFKHPPHEKVWHILQSPFKCSKKSCQAHYCRDCCDILENTFSLCALCSTPLNLYKMSEGEPGLQRAIVDYDMEISSSDNGTYERFIAKEIDLCYQMKLKGPREYSNTKVISKEESMRLKKKEKGI